MKYSESGNAMIPMKPSILCPATVIDAYAQYPVAGNLDGRPCAVEVKNGSDEPDVVEIMLDSTGLRLGVAAAAESGRLLSATSARSAANDRL